MRVEDREAAVLPCAYLVLGDSIEIHSEIFFAVVEHIMTGTDCLYIIVVSFLSALVAEGIGMEHRGRRG